MRSSHEQGSRFDTQERFWDVPRQSLPERTLRWTQVVVCAHYLLVLARPLVEECDRLWEKRRSDPTLAQVRQALPTLLRPVDTPARPPQLRSICTGTRRESVTL
ncbi:MAG TPA: hypothetical protein VGF67_24610 [Ktedonobacteraceae bacterium]|jgi:hypothetical protein